MVPALYVAVAVVFVITATALVLGVTWTLALVASISATAWVPGPVSVKLGVVLGVWVCIYFAPSLGFILPLAALALAASLATRGKSEEGNEP